MQCYAPLSKRITGHFLSYGTFAFREAMPPKIISESAFALKDTSLGLIVGYGELVRQ